MGNYKSRPTTTCSDELKKKLSEGYAVLRSRLSEDLRPDPSDWSPLQAAVFRGELEPVQRLWEEGGGLESRDTGQTIVHLACFAGLTNTNNTNNNTNNGNNTNNNGNNTNNSNGGVAEWVLAQPGLPLEAVTRRGFTALHLAVFRAQGGLVKALLSAGCDANNAGLNRLPPLHLSAMCGNAEVALLLLGAGACLSDSDWAQYSALLVAAYFAHEKVVVELLKQGADVNQCGGVKESSAHIASAKGTVNVLGALVEAGADVSCGDDEGNLPLHFAAKGGFPGVVEVLLGAPTAADPHQPNLYGDTPLHCAAYSGKLQVHFDSFE